MTREEYYNHIFNQSMNEIGNEEIYAVFFSQIVSKLEKNKGIKVLVGNQDGSRARGLSNRSSDIDMHIFGETGNTEIAYELMWETGNTGDKMIIYDIAPHCLELTLENVAAYSKVHRKYPTVFYRTEEEKKKYMPEKIHWNVRYREDGEMFEFIQLLIADTIFIKQQEKDRVDISNYYRMVKTVDMLDLQYVRAYGNYNNLMTGKNEVPVRKYLYTLYEIFFCVWMLHYGTRPPMLFEQLVQGQKFDEDVLYSIQEKIKLNNSSIEHKIKLKCESDPILNNYINKMLILLQKEIASYDLEERYISVINRTEPMRRQKIIYF